MKLQTRSLSAIRHFRLVGGRFGTGGQPTESQFQAIRAAGFEAVINLALPTSDHALANEGGFPPGWHGQPARAAGLPARRKGEGRARQAGWTSGGGGSRSFRWAGSPAGRAGSPCHPFQQELNRP